MIQPESAVSNRRDLQEKLSVLRRHILKKADEFLLHKDNRWLLIWISGLFILWIWDLIFLNRPAFIAVQSAFFNTLFVALLGSVLALAFAWLTTNALYFSSRRSQHLYAGLRFVTDLIRSVPQIIGILLLYVLLTGMIQKDMITASATILILMALIIAVFVFPETTDLMLERIEHFRRRDFFNAMLVCGISEWRIVNYEILWKNSRIHLFNKLIAVIGMTVFLQSSIDFIVSVGLSTEISTLNFPNTLGSLLAKIDSKQDILAIGHTLLNPGYVSKLFFNHLQGISVAFLIVFSLLCIYRIADGFARRHRI